MAVLPKHSTVLTLKKAGVSEERKERSLPFGITRYLFGSHEVSMSYLT